jgi:hypothetical protein
MTDKQFCFWPHLRQHGEAETCHILRECRHILSDVNDYAGAAFGLNPLPLVVVW